ncbi:MAG: hypothetical protein EOO15_15805 [Chitinophagaceae bacterium]|nr:MAG: hypothetical protein EOO15_15805 [Chitinophagaceae bacterium]
MTNKLLYRVVALTLHLFLNFIVISYLLSFDWTGSWLRFFGFVLILMLLFVLFVKHVLSFLQFLKSKA